MVQPEQRKCETLEEDDPRRKFDADGDNVMCSTTVKLSWFSGAQPHAVSNVSMPIGTKPQTHWMTLYAVS